MSEDLTESVVQLIVDTPFEPLPKPAPLRRLAVVRKAEEFVRSSPSPVVRVHDVCRHLGVSERTLRYVFGGVTGMSPAAYLRVQRFNHARRSPTSMASGISASSPATI